MYSLKKRQYFNYTSDKLIYILMFSEIFDKNDEQNRKKYLF